MGDVKIPQKISGKKHEKNSTLMRVRQRWEVNIKNNFKESR
jgi:hypothetical protein